MNYTKPYDISDRLRTPEEISLYLETAIEQGGDVEFIRRAVGDSIKALSKLRAEGVQAGDERMRKTLQTLVDMYVLNQGSEYEQITCYTPAIARDLTRNQRARNQTWKAWDAARAALASTPVAEDQASVRHASGHQFHVLKTDPDVFQAVLSGAKTFEIRLNDRGYAVGDALGLRETKHTGAEMRAGAPLEYTGRECLRFVSHVLTGYGLADGWCCLSFKLPHAGGASAPVANGDQVVAYLDLGEGGYMDVGTDLTDEKLAALPKGRHMLVIAGTHGADGYTQNATGGSPVAGLTDDAILHRWNTHVGQPDAARPLTDADKIAFARAVLMEAGAPVAGEATANTGDLPVWWRQFMNELTLRSEDEVRNDLPGILEICALDAIGNAAPQASEAVRNHALDDAREVLTDEEILDRWDTHVGDSPITESDKLCFAREIESDLLSKLSKRDAKDAARYRWWCDTGNDIAAADTIGGKPTIDAAIDAAMAALSAQPGAQTNGESDD